MKKTRQNVDLTKHPGQKATVQAFIQPPTSPLLHEIRNLIEQSRQRVAATVNTELTVLYWRIGQRIRVDLLKEERAEYGAEIVYSLSTQLVSDYGSGFSKTNLFHMIRFAEVFPEEKIVYSLSTQLSWTHFRDIIHLDDPLQRDFYAEMCRVERWSTRTLRAKIQGCFSNAPPFLKNLPNWPARNSPPCARKT